MKVTFLIPPSLDGKQSVDRTSGCNRSLYFIALLPFLYSATLLKEEVEELVIVKETAEFRKALADCIANAKKLGPVVYNPIMAPFWIVSCMTQKGFTVSTKYIKDLLF